MPKIAQGDLKSRTLEARRRLGETVAEVRPGGGGGEDVGTRLVAAKDSEGCFLVAQRPRLAAYCLLLRVRVQFVEG